MLALGSYHFPSELLPSDGRTALLRLETFISGSRLLLYECRLSNGVAAVDVSTKYVRSESDIKCLQKLCDDQTRNDPKRGQSFWPQLRRFCNDWNSDGPLAAIDYLYLEYDCNGTGQTVAAPALFVSVENGLATTPDVIPTTLSLFIDKSDTIVSTLLRVVEEAEKSGLIIGKLLGLMRSRDDEIRIMIKNLQVGKVRHFLQRLNWSGDIEAVEGALMAIDAPMNHIRFVLGLQGDWSPRFGFEIYCPTVPDHDRFKAFLKRQAEICSRKVDALATWTGVAGGWRNNRLVQDFAIPKTQLNNMLAACSKQVNHYKLNFDETGLREIKAYLSLQAHQHVHASCT